MKFAICNETFVDWPWERVVGFAAELGYDGVEIAPFTLADHVAQVEEGRRREIRRAAERAKIAILGLHWLLVKPPGLYVTHPDASVRTRTADYILDLVRFCSDVGGQLMVFGSPKQRNLLPGVTRAQAMGYAREVFERALPEADRRGVTLAIEPLSRQDTDFINTAADGIELIEAINHPRFRLHLDVKGMSGSETQPIPDVIRSSAKYLVHFHANDPNLLGPGMGDVDHRPFVKALKEIGYKGYLSVEVFDYKPGAEKIARDSIAYLRRVTQEA